MRPTHRLWYLLVAFLVVAPAAARVLTWSRPRPTPVDPAAARAGETLFKHDWKPRDPLSPQGDGLGPVFNATSCLACHNQGGPGGGGGLEHNVTTFTVRAQLPGQKPREGVVHARGVGGLKETLKDVHPDLPAISQPSLEQVVRMPGSRGSHCLTLPPPVHMLAVVGLRELHREPALGVAWLAAFGLSGMYWGAFLFRLLGLWCYRVRDAGVLPLDEHASGRDKERGRDRRR